MKRLLYTHVTYQSLMMLYASVVNESVCEAFVWLAVYIVYVGWFISRHVSTITFIWTKVHSARSSLVVTHPRTKRGRRLTSHEAALVATAHLILCMYQHYTHQTIVFLPGHSDRMRINKRTANVSGVTREITISRTECPVGLTSIEEGRSETPCHNLRDVNKDHCYEKSKQKRTWYKYNTYTCNQHTFQTRRIVL
jgi:hypothetical protein